jgi:hypothetical protein
LVLTSEVGVGFLRGRARPPLNLIVEFVDRERSTQGVEPICAVLTEHGMKIAPSTYYAAKSRPPSARAVAGVSGIVRGAHRTITTRRDEAASVSRASLRKGHWRSQYMTTAC